MDVTMNGIEHLSNIRPLATISASTMNTTQLILLGVGVAMLLVMIAWQRIHRQNLGGPVRNNRQDDLGNTPREIAEVMAQLEQLSRQIHHKIDGQLARLDASVRMADERINQLAQLERSRQGVPALDVELASETPDQAEPRDDDPHQPIYRLADAGYTPIQIARKLSRHTGEVELILSLRRAKRASA